MATKPIADREDFKWLVAGASILALHAGTVRKTIIFYFVLHINESFVLSWSLS
jgi:hypothetical protein